MPICIWRVCLQIADKRPEIKSPSNLRSLGRMNAATSDEAFLRLSQLIRTIKMLGPQLHQASSLALNARERNQ